MLNATTKTNFMQTFEFREMIDVLGMDAAKAKNWTVGRPFKIEASIRTASGHGSRNLYSLEDVYLMGLANELSHAGMAANAIGKLLEDLKTKVTTGLANIRSLHASRDASLRYHIETNEDRLPNDTPVRIRLDVLKLRNQIDHAVKRLGGN